MDREGSKPPPVPAGNDPAGPWSSWIWLLAGILCALGMVASIQAVLPQIEATMDDFFVDLPSPTRWVLAGRQLAWLAALAPLVAWLLWPRPRYRGLAAAAPACWRGRWWRCW